MFTTEVDVYYLLTNGTNPESPVNHYVMNCKLLNNRVLLTGS